MVTFCCSSQRLEFVLVLFFLLCGLFPLVVCFFSFAIFFLGFSTPKPVSVVVADANTKKPTYLAMAKKAILSHSGGKRGTAFVSILRYIETNYPVHGNYKLFLRNALRKGVENKAIERISKNTFAFTPKTPSKTEEAKEKKLNPVLLQKKNVHLRHVVKVPQRLKNPRKKIAKEKKQTTRGKKKTSKEKKQTTREKKTKRGTSTKASSRKRGRLGVEGEDDLVWVWQFKENDDKFHNYDPRASAVVEGVYQEYLSSPSTTDVRAVKSGEWEYMVDFRLMTQQNIQHEAHTVRKIRRVQIPASEKSNRKLPYDD